MTKPRHMLRRYLKEREAELHTLKRNGVPGCDERLDELRRVISLCEERGRF